MAFNLVIFHSLKKRDSSQYQKVASSTGGEFQLMRLYAMGADAWLLINHFNELRQVPGYTLSGLTGQLSAGPNCNVDRDMTWYQVQDSNVVAGCKLIHVFIKTSTRGGL